MNPIASSLSSLVSNRDNAFFFFFFSVTATTEIYTLSLHDALPICLERRAGVPRGPALSRDFHRRKARSEEHTSELQSRRDLVCRLLLEKKKCPSKMLSLYVNQSTNFTALLPGTFFASTITLFTSSA